MKRSLLITVSGMVGSGKSTAVVHALATLAQGGVDATEWRFQSLPCFSWLGGEPVRPAVPSTHGAAPSAPRWAGYRRKRLTGRVALGYLARILAFRLFRLTRGAGGCYVSNRYFYDNLAHYHLQTRPERFYAAVVTACIPTPDLAVLMVASPATIAARRPSYAAEYVSQVHSGYERLRVQFPAMEVIPTDGPEPGAVRLDTLLHERFGLPGRPLQ